MPEIVFKGKEYVYNHHLTVPYRPLVPHADKGLGPVDLAGNLVVHGDNLQALKSLLPRYAGQVDLVFIDPPYNTGNEGWVYSDGVTSPIMREWLDSNPVDAEDMLRHDKWLCMMWPRLVLLRELLSERGSIWITLDDNEVHRARMMLDEIFGEDHFVGCFVWQNVGSAGDNKAAIASDHGFVMAYARESSAAPNRPRSSIWSDVPTMRQAKAMLTKMAPSSRRNSRSNANRGYIMHSHLSWRQRSSASLPTTSPSHLRIRGSLTLSL